MAGRKANARDRDGKDDDSSAEEDPSAGKGKPEAGYVFRSRFNRAIVLDPEFKGLGKGFQSAISLYDEALSIPCESFWTALYSGRLMNSLQIAEICTGHEYYYYIL